MHLEDVSSVPPEVYQGHNLSHVSEVQASQTSEKPTEAFPALSVESSFDKFDKVRRRALLGCIII